MNPPDDDITACLVHDARDGTEAQQIIAGLRDVGVHAEAHATGCPAESVLVLITERAVRDVVWRAAVEGHGAARLVPVRSGGVHADLLPPGIRELNWIDWDAREPARAKAQTLTALSSDPGRYRTHQALAAEAQTWDTEGRLGHLLIGDARRAVRAQRHLVDAARDPLSRPSPLIEDFVAASLRRTKAKRRARSRRWTVRSCAATLAVAAVASMFFGLRQSALTGRLNSLSSYAGVSEARPDLRGLWAGAALVQGDAEIRGFGRADLRRVLAVPWSSGVLGTSHDASVYAAVPSADGRRVLTVDAVNSLTSWDAEHGSVRWRRSLGPGSAQLLDVLPDETTAVAVSGKTLHFIMLEPWSHTVVPLEDRPFSVVLSGDGNEAVLEYEDSLVTVDRRKARVSGPERAYDEILDVRRTRSGRVQALVRRGGRLSLVDASSGRILADARTPAHRFETGALGPDGEAVVTGEDGQLLYARKGLELRPTGRPVTEPLEVLALLPDGRVVFGGVQLGVTLVDLEHGLVLGLVCRSLAGIQDVTAADDGDLLACLNHTGVDLWRTSELSPVARPASTAVPEGAAPITLKVPGKLGNVVEGSVSGEVVELAPTGGGPRPVSRWRAPDATRISTMSFVPGTHRLVVSTAGGLWWRVPGCFGCSDAELLADLGRRLWPCYTEEAITVMTDETREELGVSVCPVSPRPQAG